MCSPWVNPGLSKPTIKEIFWINLGNLNRDFVLLYNNNFSIIIL